MLAGFSIDKTLYPFASRWIDLPSGAKVHYVDEGRGPLLLLLHGNPTWSFLYRDIIAGLKDQFRCIAPDYPGFGQSTAPTDFKFTAREQAFVIAEFVQALDIADYTIMMQDWGGPIGFSLAQQAPEKASGFIIGNTWAWPLERWGQKMFSRIMGGPIGRASAFGFNGVVRLFMSRGVVKPLKRSVLNMYLAPFRQRSARSPTHIFPRQLRHAAPFLKAVFDNMPALANKPALILWGEKDFAFQAPERSRFEQLFPRAQTILLPRAGHFIQEDASVEIVKEVSAWYRRAFGRLT